MSNQSGQTYGLTVLSPIIEDDASIDVCHATELRWYLARVKDQDCFAKIDSTHLARLVVMDDVVFVGAPACEEHLKSRYLVFETNFDGDLDTYLTRMATETPEFVDSVWKHCVGYPGVRNPADFVAYIKKCQLTTTFFFADVNNRTVQQNLKALRVQAGVAHFIEKHQGRPPAEIQKAWQVFLKAMNEMPAQVGGHQHPRMTANGVSVS
jgi:hypothetical protein